jgi:hypothetical protein
VLTPIVRILRLASFVICVIVITSFVVFALDQTKTASGRQTEAITGHAAPAPSTTKNENDVHRAIEEASDQLTSPFAGLVSGTSSEWAARGVKLLLALVLYGFGLGYLARALRVRV